MKKLIILALTVACILCGCNKVQEPTEEKEVLKAGAIVNPECTTVVDEYTGDLDGDGEEDSICVYTSAEELDGELMLDDMNTWCVIANIAGNAYDLFCGDVSIGEITYNVYENADGKLIISVAEQSTAKYTVTQYSVEDEGLVKTQVIDEQGINMMSYSGN